MKVRFPDSDDFEEIADARLENTTVIGDVIFGDLNGISVCVLRSTYPFGPQ